MKSELFVRDMNLGDVSEVYSLGSGENEFEVVEDKEGFWRKEVLENWVSSEDDIALVASNEKELAGFILVAYHPVTHKATFENAYVKSEYRRLDVAGKMYQEAESKLRKLGADFVCSFVEQDNEASRRFLEKSGFDTGKSHYWMNKFL